MLNIVIDFSKQDIEIKLADTVPAKSIKKAKIPYQSDNGHIDKINSVIADLRKAHGDTDTHISVNLPALFEDLVEVKSNDTTDILVALKQKNVVIDDKLLLSHKGFDSGRGSRVIPIALVDCKYQSIMSMLPPAQYTTNILRLADVAERDNTKGHVTIVYNSEEHDSEILFFNENNVPVAYTKTILGEGITGLADTQSNKSRVPIDKRRIKSLSHNLGRQFDVTYIPPQPGKSSISDIDTVHFVDEDGQMTLLTPTAHTETTEKVDQGPPVQDNNQQHMQQEVAQDIDYDEPEHNEYIEEQPTGKQKKAKKVKPAKQPKPPKPAKPQKQPKQPKQPKSEPTEEGRLQSPRKLMSPKLVAVIITLLLVVSIGVSISSKMLIDLNLSKSENNYVTFDETQETVPLMTYVSSAMSTIGVRPNTVQSLIDENDKEKLILGINNIDDDTLIMLQTKLENRCTVNITELEPVEDTESGNRCVSLEILYK